MSKICTVSIAIVFIFVISLVNANVSRTNITVSGVSSGASMATQLHIAFSKDISGSGVLAGPPYYCAGSLLSAAACMSGPITSISVSGIEKKLKSFVSAGTVDSTSNIRDDPVYIFSGKYDPVALPSIVKLNEKLYSSLGANIKTNYDLPATHGIPTEHFGNKCAIPNTANFINNW
jgi:predicted esterase